MFNRDHLSYGIREIPSSEITLTEKHVLNILLSCINPKTHTSWYGMETLAEKACMSERGLQYNLKKLEQKKFIYITHNTKGGRSKTNTYKLNEIKILSYYTKLNGARGAPFMDKNETETVHVVPLNGARGAPKVKIKKIECPPFGRGPLIKKALH